MSTERTTDDRKRSAGRAYELAHALSRLLQPAARVQVFDRRGKLQPAKKRRHRMESSLLLDITDLATVAELAEALRVRRDSEVMDWMQWPDLWFEFIGENGNLLVMLGFLRPGWLRWDPHGDIQLAVPDSLEELLAPLGLDDTSSKPF